MVWPALIGAAAGLIGGAAGGDRSRKAAHEQMDMQREFAQQGVRWRVEDAKAAGVHPLYALGAQTHSFQPIAVGDSVGSSIASAGQDIGRAIDATRTQRERSEAEAQAFMLARVRESDARVRADRQEARADAALASQLANDEAQRALWLSQARRLEQVRNPPMAGGDVEDSRGSVDTGRVLLKPVEQSARDPHVSSKTSSSEPMWQRVETSPGVFRDFPNPKLNLDSDLVHAILAGQAYVDKWVSDTFFGGAPKYIQVRPRRVSPSNVMYEQPSYQRHGVYRKGK